MGEAEPEADDEVAAGASGALPDAPGDGDEDAEGGAEGDDDNEIDDDAALDTSASAGAGAGAGAGAKGFAAYAEAASADDDGGDAGAAGGGSGVGRGGGGGGGALPPRQAGALEQRKALDEPAPPLEAVKPAHLRDNGALQQGHAELGLESRNPLFQQV